MRYRAVLAVEPGALRLHVRPAFRLYQRLTGLIAQPLPEPGAGLWIEPCSAVHTFGVRGSLDLVFVSSKGDVLRVCHGVPSGRIRGAWRARAVLELRAGEARRLGLQAGVHLRWIDDSREAES